MIEHNDASTWLKSLPSSYAQTCVTSPPYFALRDYQTNGQLGLEKSPQEYLDKMVAIFKDLHRVLRDDGTLWLNMGDTYKNKSLLGMPWKLAFALQDSGWLLRSDIIWEKPSAMPESCRDRPTKSHEYLFLLTKKPKYYFDSFAIREPCAASTLPRALRAVSINNKYADGFIGQAKQGLSMPRASEKKQHTPGQPPHSDKSSLRDPISTGFRNKRTVWKIPAQSFKGSHFATFPEKLVKPCILAGSSEEGCCSSCGSPMKRIVHKSGGTTGKSWHDHSMDGVEGQRKFQPASLARYLVETVGWERTCDCESDLVPCMVIDPFLGSGTTLLVAKKLKRNGHGCDLNPEYCEMARKRIDLLSA